MSESVTVRVADVLRAALDVLSDEDYARLAARIDLIAPPVDPAKVYTRDEMSALLSRVTAIVTARNALATAIVMHDATSLHGFDASDAQVQAAARALAGLVGGARG